MIFHTSLLGSFVHISVVSVVISPLSFMILLIWALFFMVSLAKRSINFVYLSKEPAHNFIGLFYFFSLLELDCSFGILFLEVGLFYYERPS